MKLSSITSCLIALSIAALSCPASATAATTVTGKLVLTAMISVESSLATGEPIVCTLTAAVNDADLTAPYTFFNDFSDTASKAAVLTGSVAKCTVTIPYAWTLSALSTDTISLFLQVTTQECTCTTPPAPTRLLSRSLSAIKIPSNGATTTLPTVNLTF